MGVDDSLVPILSEKSVPFQDVKELSPLIHQISKSRIVMLGEASHGTHEFYDWRRMISEWLIVKHGFNFIACEADWPPSQTVNRYILNNEGRNAREALESFKRWPTWMWANTEVVRLAEWMRSHNERVSDDKRVGFYGIDVYSLFESIDVVLKQLEKINPFLARRARIRYGCFDRFNRDERKYARSLVQFPEGCEEQVIQMLEDLLKLNLDEATGKQDALFDAQQNARIIKNAENYYRTMMHGTEDSWNVRDRHMLETLDLLLRHYGQDSKAIVWAHNTHIGDYRATDMESMGQVNLGGLARERYGESAVSLLGFGTYEGSVIASNAWDGPIQILQVPPARLRSYDALFHEVAASKEADCLYCLFDQTDREGPLAKIRGQRAIGVVYDPAHERWGNYVPTSLARRYDAFMFIDRTECLEPLIQPFDQRKIPETWPVGR